MKSVVQEASTIGKAIELGWKAAGEPRDFSTKVLEVPQHNFLGFTTKSAKVAIVFEENAPREGTPREKRESREREQRAREPRRDSRDRGSWRDSQSRSDSRSERPSRDRSRSSRDESQRDMSQRDVSPRDRERPARDESSRDSRDGGRTRERRDRYQSRDQRDTTREAYRSTRPSIPESPVNERVDFGEADEFENSPTPVNSIVAEALAPQSTQATSFGKQLGQWDDELVASAHKWLGETLRLMGLTDVTFTLEPQNFHLRITLSKPLIDDDAKEKHLFASLSTLMIASLKKEFRKALRGHKIVIVHG